MNANLAMRILCAAAAFLAVGPADHAQDVWISTRLDLDMSFAGEEGLTYIEGELVLRNTSEVELEELLLAVQGPFADEFQVFGDLIGESHIRLPGTASSITCAQIQLTRPVAPGEECVLGFAYAGKYEKNQFSVRSDFAYGSWVTHWYPIPLGRGGEIPNQTPTVMGQTVMRMPPEWHGVTNGELSERRVDDSEAVETWNSERAVARSFVAGPYQVEEFVLGERRIAVHLLSEKRTSARDQAVILARALEAMEARFGPYPYASYRIAEAPADVGGWGASSEQGFIVAKPNFFGVEGGNLPLFAHEAAHGWWGNLVGQTGPGSILCSESLAQYGAVVAIEALEGKAAATEFLRFSRPSYIPIQCARGYFLLASQGNDLPLSQLTGGGWQHNLADAKGHWFFHMLRRRVGDDAFFATLRGVLKSYAGQRMSLDDLRAAFIDVAAPDANMERFLAQWLDRKGAPRLEVDWSYDEATGRTDLEILQVQDGEPYELRLDVALVAADGAQQLTEIRLDGARTVASIEGAPPVDVLLDPAHALLLWTPEYQ